MIHRIRVLVLATLIVLPPTLGKAEDDRDDPTSDAGRRLALMKNRVSEIRIQTGHRVIPDQLEPEPLFRYDDPTREVVDGTVWRLGSTGRPFAVITTELHPEHDEGPGIVYDMLSFTNRDFDVFSLDLEWRPKTFGAKEFDLTDDRRPETSSVLRLVQMKSIMDRFEATQKVQGELVQLRRLPTPVHRYLPEYGDDERDGAMFLYVNGRNPGLVVLLETDGEAWSFWVGRLSQPSALSLTLDGTVVWYVGPLPAETDWDAAFTSAFAPAEIPGFEARKTP